MHEEVEHPIVLGRCPLHLPAIASQVLNCLAGRAATSLQGIRLASDANGTGIYKLAEEHLDPERTLPAGTFVVPNHEINVGVLARLDLPVAELKILDQHGIRAAEPELPEIALLRHEDLLEPGMQIFLLRELERTCPEIPDEEACSVKD